MRRGESTEVSDILPRSACASNYIKNLDLGVGEPQDPDIRGLQKERFRNKCGVVKILKNIVCLQRV